MRTVNFCPACGDKNYKVVKSQNAEVVRRFKSYSKKKYNGLLDSWLKEITLGIYGCSNCGHHWYCQIPSERQLMKMYAEGRLLKDPNPKEMRTPKPYMVSEMKRLRRLFPNLKSPSLLDFGSGFGGWAKAAKDVGFEVWAFEPSVSRAKEKDTDFIQIYDLATVSGKKFDAINIEQVLEHLPNPCRTLREIRAYCHENTVVRLTTPNLYRSYEGDDLWSSWPYDGVRAHTMAPFEHLQGFTPESLRQLIIRSHFQSLSYKERGLNYWKLTLRNYLCKRNPKLGQTLALAKLKT